MSDELLPLLAFGIPAVMLLLLFLSHRARVRRYAEEVDRLRQMLADGSYFTSTGWLAAFDFYRRHHTSGRIPMKSLSGDLQVRHMKSLLIRYGSWLPIVLVVPPMTAAILLISCADAGWWDNENTKILLIGLSFLPEVIVAILIIMFLRSHSVLGEWKEKNPGLRAALPRIESSYLSGRMFQCGPCCLVLGKDYVHAYNGTEFMTLERFRISRLSWHVEFHRFINRGRLWSRECCFFLVIESSRGGAPYRIQLDQFQIRLFMDEFGSPVTDGCDRCGDFQVSDVNAARSMFTVAGMGRCSKPVLPGSGY